MVNGAAYLTFLPYIQERPQGVMVPCAQYFEERNKISALPPAIHTAKWGSR